MADAILQSTGDEDMTRIEELTPEQIARTPEIRDKWIKIGLSTEPADRTQAEIGIAEAYRVAKLPAPKIVWCGSPLAMVFTRAVVLGILQNKVRASVWASVGASVWASVRANVRDSVGDSVRASVWASVRDSVRDSVGASVGASVWASVRDSVGASVGDSVRASVWDSVRANVRDSVGASVFGQHDANWLAFYDYFAEVCGLHEQTSALSGIRSVAKSAGWWLPHEETCWVSERTSVVSLDDNKRPHSATGPAIAYPDGWSIYSWHGTTVPKDWIVSPKNLTPTTALTHENIEQRRAACEILGWERILSELNAVSIDKDGDPQIGELVEVEIPDIGKEKFLRVTCGTGRKFALPVPPHVKTALQANAWTFAIPEDFMQLKEFRT